MKERTANSAGRSQQDSVAQVPQGWLIARLGEICTPPQYGWTTSAKRDGEGLKLLRTTDISSGNVDWSKVPHCANEPEDPEKYLLAPGDILVSRAGSVGLSHLIRACPPAVFASYLIRFRPRPPIVSEFVALFMKSNGYWAGIADETTGIAVPNVNATKLSQIELPLPPLREQKRIVSKVEDLLDLVKMARERLRSVQTILKRFRQSVLAAACSGRLTEDWRASNQRADWSYSSLGERRITARIGPFGSLLHRADYAEGGVPLVNPTHMRDGAIYPSADCAVAEAKVTELSAYRLRTGDIVVGRRGEMGRAAVVQASQSGFLCGTGSMFIRVKPDEFNPEFLCLVLRSPQSVAALGDGAVGSTMQNLNQKALAAVSVPDAALVEQAEVVRRAKVFFGLADAIETRVGAAAARIETLTQAILAKAFRGKLVPTEAELARHAGHGYEPAAELLSRVRAQPEKPADGRDRRRSSGSSRELLPGRS